MYSFTIRVLYFIHQVLINQNLHNEMQNSNWVEKKTQNVFFRFFLVIVNPYEFNLLPQYQRYFIGNSMTQRFPQDVISSRTDNTEP